VTAPEGRTDGDLQPPQEWLIGHEELSSADLEDQREYDAWFRWVADPEEVAERDRRLTEAREGVAEAVRSGDWAGFEVSTARRDDAFWTLPVPEDAKGQRDLAADHADDDADGWY
jgi:hypothetical protein